MVGTSGSCGTRCALLMAIALILPALMCGKAEARLSIISVTCPPSRSVIAGPLPLYGMPTMSMPAIDLKNSPVRCCDVPVPGYAQLIVPGAFFAASTSSFTVLEGRLGWPTSISGTVNTPLTMAKSLSGS